MSNVKANIKHHNVLDGATVVVGATLSHGRVMPDMASVSAALGAQTDYSLTVIPGSIRTVEKSNFRSTITAAMRPSAEALPYVKGMDGFKAVSSNVYMDESERMWTLENSADGKVLIRSHVVDDESNIQELMQSCSSVSGSNIDHQAMRSLSAASQLNSVMVEPSDIVSFVRNGNLEIGAIIASESSGDHIAMSFNTSKDEGALTISQSSIIHNFGDVGGGVEYPEDTTLVALSGNARVDDLLDYYQKLYGHNEEFFNKLAAQITSYAFC